MTNASGCTPAGEVAALRSTVASLEAQVAALQRQMGIRESDGRRLEVAGGAPCSPAKRDRTNLVELLPSLAGADLTRSDGRCSRRYRNFERAWNACMNEPACVGVSKDNGLPCGGLHPFELRGGGVHRGPGTSWVCEARLAASVSQNSVAAIAAHAPPNAAQAREGFVFIVLGACALPGLDCKFLREVRDAIAALRATFPSRSARPIAVVSDGGISASALIEHLKCDLVHPIPTKALLVSSMTTVSDVRVRKLLAYRAPPFERNVFFDGDTHVRHANVELLFSTLDHFDLASAFECCRIDYSSSGLPYDRNGFMRGWEMQTGVMAYRRTQRLDDFWAETIREYESRSNFWGYKSSGEQGAATLALARVDVRYVPLPPSFNARPFTMLSYISAFGLPVYHGKDLWQRKDLAGQNAHVEAIIAQRMLRDWDQTRDLLAAQFAPEFLSNVSRGSRRNGPAMRHKRRVEGGGNVGAGARRNWGERRFAPKTPNAWG